MPNFEPPRDPAALCSLDWVTLTLTADTVDLARRSDNHHVKVPALLGYIGLPYRYAEEQGHGESGYERLIVLDVPGARLRVGGNAGTASLQLSGGALRYYSEHLGLDVFAFLSYLSEIGARCTRLDWAFDDKAGLLDFEQLSEWIRPGGDGDLVTIFRKTPQLQGSKVFGGDDWTIYFGAVSSDSRVRVYDKHAELTGKSQDPGCDAWVRNELQLRSDKADKAFHSWVNGSFASAYMLGVLRGTVDFRIPTEDTNKTRWPIAQAWGLFVGAVEVLKVQLAGKIRTMEQMRTWLQKQVAKALAMAVEVWGDDFLSDLLADGRDRITAEDLQLMTVTRACLGTGPPTDRPPAITSWGSATALGTLRAQMDRRQSLKAYAWAMRAI